MERKLLNDLNQWLFLPERKPLIIRGARQVGKTWLIRHFAKINSRSLIEINFEKHPERANLFESNEPQQILLNLSVLFRHNIDLENTILFLDEIQVVPELLAKLRWFAEDLPQLAVIAAGSLLEFVLSKHAFSMPVGRIGYLHLEPMSFEEFLSASGNVVLCDYLAKYHFSMNMPMSVHEQFMQCFQEYLLVGGMPAVVSTWLTHHSFIHVNQIQHDILTTYRDDFAKYRGHMIIERLEETMRAIPRLLGKKIIFSQINAQTQANTVKQALTLLEKARICHQVYACAANGVPLGAELREKYFKEIFLDIGLCNALLGLDLNHIRDAKDITLINNGGIAEQVVGQMLRLIYPPYREPELYYWTRDKKGASAEIDYVIQHGPIVIPIEVKAGSSGSLKSLHYFMKLKNLSRAVRLYSGLPHKTEMKIKDVDGMSIEYTLLSLPFYLIGQMARLLEN